MLLRRSFVCVFLASPLLWGQTAEPKRTLDVPYVPTTEAAVDAMLKLANVTSSDIVYDLGCGDGRIVIAAARKYGAHAVGVDLNPDRIAEAKANAKKAGVEDLVRFEEGDLFKADIHEATVVTLFLLSSVNMRLRPRLLSELRPGTRIVSNTFDMGDWKPEKEDTVGNTDEETFLSHKLYYWVVPQKENK